MTTIILGSREDPVFPDVLPENVIYINGSILQNLTNLKN